MMLALTESSSPVGSSARMMAGSFARAAAMATRCCSPPLSSPGLWFFLSLSPTMSMSSSTRRSCSSPETPSAIMGSFAFSAAVRVGIRFRVWNM